MSRIETFISSGEEPIIEGDLDDTVNDCDNDFELEAPKTKSRKVYELHKPYVSLEEAQNENGLFDSLELSCIQQTSLVVLAWVSALLKSRNLVNLTTLLD